MVYREKLRWMLRMKCGHLGFRGWILPPDELERRGWLNEQLKEQEINKKTYSEEAEKRAIAKAERELWHAQQRGSLDYEMQRWKERST